MCYLGSLCIKSECISSCDSLNLYKTHGLSFPAQLMDRASLLYRAFYTLFLSTFHSYNCKFLVIYKAYISLE